MLWPAFRCLPLFTSLLFACTPRSDADTVDISSRCPIVLVDSALPASPAAGDTLRTQGTRWTNTQIREMYVCRVNHIGAEDETWKAQGLDAETRARKAYEIRHLARLTARAMMDNRAEVAALEARDLKEYGDKDGPTWDWLVTKAQNKGLTGDAVYLSIIESAQKTNEAVNKSLGL